MNVDRVTNLEGEEISKDIELKVGDKFVIHSGSERYFCKVVSRDDYNKQYYVDVNPIYSINEAERDTSKWNINIIMCR